jgi:NAD(P)-dependent dehydrogenase (short-subunit alcohol dehydrogenase family)
MTEHIDQRVAVITGAGRGIGREHALAFARRGVAVVVNDVGGSVAGEGSSAAPAQQLVDLIRAEGGQAVADTSDISEPDGAAEVVRTALTAFGRLDTLVNNAGILRDRTLLNMDVADWDLVVKVHLRGTFLTTQAAGRHWRDHVRAGGAVDARIVNTSSGSGLFGNFGQSNYGPAKAGIANLTIVTAMELGRYGVTANAIAPLAKTRLMATVGTTEEIDEGFDPLDPRHVSPLVVWLGGPGSRDVTGRVFSVVGGYVGVAEGWSMGPALQHDGPLTVELIEDELPGVLARAAENFDVRRSSPYTSAG